MDCSWGREKGRVSCCTDGVKVVHRLDQLQLRLLSGLECSRTLFIALHGQEIELAEDGEEALLQHVKNIAHLVDAIDVLGQVTHDGTQVMCRHLVDRTYIHT